MSFSNRLQSSFPNCNWNLGLIACINPSNVSYVVVGSPWRYHPPLSTVTFASNPSWVVIRIWLDERAGNGNSNCDCECDCGGGWMCNSQFVKKFLYSW